VQPKGDRWHDIAGAAIAAILGWLATGCTNQSRKPTRAAAKAPDSPTPSEGQVLRKPALCCRRP